MHSQQSAYPARPCVSVWESRDGGARDRTEEVCVLFFDLDGTLVDQDHIRLTSLRVVRHVHAPHCDEGRLVSLHDQVIEELVLQQQLRPISLRNAGVMRFRRVAQQIQGSPVCVEEVPHWYETYRNAHQRALRPVEGSMQLVQGLHSRGFRLGLITNDCVDEQMHKLEVPGLRTLFEVVVISDAVAMHKPEPGMFLLAARLARAPHGLHYDRCFTVKRYPWLRSCGIPGRVRRFASARGPPAGVLRLESCLPHEHCIDKLISFLS